MSDELRYVDACLASCLIPGQPVPRPPVGLDWRVFYGLVAQYRLSGLFDRLSRSAVGIWPAEFRQELRTDRYRRLLRGDHCLALVREALHALDRAGLAAIVLKGWALIPIIYGGDHGQRSYEDIDLLVRPEDAVRAGEVLGALGYCRTIGEPWPGYDRRYHHSISYQPGATLKAPAAPFVVELHWGLLDIPYYNRRINAEALFARALTVQIADITAYRLAVEDYLLHSSAHIALHHGYENPWRDSYEAAALIRWAGAGLDWRAVCERAQAWGLALPLQDLLTRVEGLWPGAVPPAALTAIRRLPVSRFERWLHNWLVADKGDLTRRSIVAWLSQPGWGHRPRYLAETVFPSPAYLQERYGPAPKGLWPLLYARRAAIALHLLRRGT